MQFSTSYPKPSKLSPHLNSEAKELEQSLTQICELAGKREVAWLKSDGGVGRLSRFARVCIVIISFFGLRNKALRYFADYSKNLPTMLDLSKRIEKLSPNQPRLVEHYWKTWRIFSEKFQIEESEYKHSFAKPSPILIRGSRSKEDINTLLSCHSVHYSSTQLVVDFANQGLLAQALWVVEAKSLDLTSLKSLLQASDYEWMKLQTSFKATPTTPLDAMALNSHEGSIGLGWGYKSANLTKLQATAAQVSRRCGVCSVEVPAFFPIGDTEMQRFLREGYPDLDGDWKEFLASFSDEKKSAFIAGSEDPLTISPQGQQLLKRIRKKIVEQFTNASYITPQIQQWLEVQKPQFVIVRSTGKEDSATNSNAGGNASIPYVRPKANLISAAMGEVLASYFGEKSLLQRLTARDTSIFTEPPFMPVLIQNMISENVGGHGTLADEVPRSGVMFTQSSGKARGLTELYVGLGNNEGIVSSRVNTDHYLLDAQKGITKVVHDKHTRFVAVSKSDGSYGCEPIDNSNDLLSHAPALPDSVAADMKRVADYFSQHYGEGGKEAALDIEFTIKMSEHGGKPTIYLLQARPLVKVAKEHEPSYLDLSVLKQSAEPIIHGKMLLDGGAYVREIHSSNEILVCDTITEALATYLISPHLKQIKTVIIKKPAPGTSHEAVTFRSHGVAALVIRNADDFAHVKEYAQEAAIKPFLVDLQRGIATPKPLTGQAICPGYICYPMPLEYSMSPSRLICNLHQKLEHPELKDPEFEAQTGKLFQAFQNKVHGLITECQGGQSLLPTKGADGKTLRQLLEIMGDGEPSMAKLAAATILHNLRSQLVNPDSPLEGDIRLELMVIIENIAGIVGKQFIPAAASPAKSLERLYPVRLVEACLFQEPGDVKGAFSYVNCLTAEKDLKAAIKIAKKLFGYSLPIKTLLLQTPYFKAGKTLLKPENTTAWNSVLSHLVTMPLSLVGQVSHLIMSLDRLGSLAEWSNVELVALLKKYVVHSSATKSQASAIFTELASMATQGAATVEDCKKIRQEMTTLHQQMAVWDDPQHIKKHAISLFSSFNKIGLTDADKLPVQYRACPKPLRMAYLTTLIEAVRTYDEIIKTCKSSKKYSDEKAKAADVHLLLTEYRKMMLALLKTANDEGLYNSMGPADYSDYSVISVETYLQKVNQGMQYHFGFAKLKKTPGFLNLNPQHKSAAECTQLLLPSKDFNVAMAVVGNQSDYTFSTVWPETLEDYFTFFHQNMEVCVSGLRTKCGFSKDLLPSELESYCSKLIDKVGPNSTKSILSSISVEGPLIQVAIDIPLRQHAGKLLITYDRSHSPPTIRTRVEMFGNPEHSRWELTASCAALIGSDIPALHLTSKPEIDFQNPKSAVFEVETRGMSSDQGDAMTTYLHFLTAASMYSTAEGSYIKATDTLRQAFHGTPAPLTPQDVSYGAFYLGLDVANQAIIKGDHAKAKAIIANAQSYMASQPWVKTIVFENGVAFRKRLKILKSLCDLH